VFLKINKKYFKGVLEKYLFRRRVSIDGHLKTRAVLVGKINKNINRKIISDLYYPIPHIVNILCDSKKKNYLPYYDLIDMGNLGVKNNKKYIIDIFEMVI
jgi:hypothetical protein